MKIAYVMREWNDELYDEINKHVPRKKFPEI